MDIDDEGTECYIGLANMGQSVVSNLSVKDETGREFTYIDEWDIDRSRDWKAGKVVRFSFPYLSSKVLG